MSIEAEWRDATEIAIDWIGLRPSLAMRTLGMNLAIAGALCAAEARGFNRGVQAARVLRVAGVL